MSHIPERTEKDCLNCGTIVQGRYCHVCGQENVVPKESFWHMFTHFFYDITHFDSAFFVTVKDLLFKPGFLSKEYMLGRRKRYLHPIKMYVFTSAMFFLLFFTFFGIEDTVKTNADEPIPPQLRQIEIARLEKRLKKDTGNVHYQNGIRMLKDTTNTLKEKDIISFYGPNPRNFITLGTQEYYSRAEYDSIQHSMPANKRDGWVMKRINLKVLHLNEKYRANPEEGFKKLGESILHKLPYMLFVSLPLFALILKLLYIRRKKFYYADHGVFTIHLYIFTFILLLAVFGIGKLQEYTGVQDLDWIIIGLFILLLLYLYLAMRRFYQQGWIKTFVKFLITTVFSLLMMLILFLLFIFFSAFTL